jgi:RNase P/RNase MRP subunit POP5
MGNVCVAPTLLLLMGAVTVLFAKVALVAYSTSKLTAAGVVRLRRTGFQLSVCATVLSTRALATGVVRTGIAGGLMLVVKVNGAE